MRYHSILEDVIKVVKNPENGSDASSDTYPVNDLSHLRFLRSTKADFAMRHEVWHGIFVRLVTLDIFLNQLAS